MESEKVKKIKKVLEQNTKTCLLYDFGKETECKVFQCKDILTYINELEGENKKLKDIGLNEEITVGEYLREMQRLKDTVAELEKEIEENVFYSKGYAQGIKNTYEVVMPDKLKQFAEMLKEKFNRQEKRFATDVTRFENDLDQVKENDLPTAKFLIGKATGQATMAEKAQYYIDETLKEVL